MNDIMLRDACANDSEFAYRVRHASFREYVEKLGSWDEDEQRQLHRQRFESQVFRIISAGGADVGIMALVVTPDCVRLNQLLLLPEHQCKGIGRACIALIIEEAHRQALPVRLRVMKANPRALAFYQALGFVQTGETHTHALLEYGLP